VDSDPPLDHNFRISSIVRMGSGSKPTQCRRSTASRLLVACSQTVRAAARSAIVRYGTLDSRSTIGRAQSRCMWPFALNLNPLSCCLTPVTTFPLWHSPSLVHGSVELEKCRFAIQPDVGGLCLEGCRGTGGSLTEGRQLRCRKGAGCAGRRWNDFFMRACLPELLAPIAVAQRVNAVHLDASESQSGLPRRRTRCEEAPRFAGVTRNGGPAR
jgi:hypothetical protein